ncbi:unnamed protein product [Spirodela intermedia]|uniref:Myb/SANT-like DNA-binding domain-containing protein n=1 Tax=Spirodela intermedia TaxID=51605 RepID=A0A7I8K4F6_SPIIN|nr:unnamed protein product [Spirodela intermedia]
MPPDSPSGGGASADVDLKRDPSPYSSSRRLPPPCWAHEETGALIQSYSQKWHALQRGNLKAAHWEEVAGAVAVRCRPLYAAAHHAGNSPKTAVQCRHKMEKLRKRYRSERRRHNHSSWVHFPQMHAMEMGAPLFIHGGGGGADRSKAAVATTVPPTHIDDDSAGALRFQITKALRATSPGLVNGHAEELLPPAEPPSAAGDMRRRKKRAAGVPLLGEMAAAVRMASDGFLRVEEMKMAAAREMEKQKMEMELRRTEMMIETQNRIVNAFIRGFSQSKKKRPKVNPEP